MLLFSVYVVMLDYVCVYDGFKTVVDAGDVGSFADAGDVGSFADAGDVCCC